MPDPPLEPVGVPVPPPAGGVYGEVGVVGWLGELGDVGVTGLVGGVTTGGGVAGVCGTILPPDKMPPPEGGLEGGVVVVAGRQSVFTHVAALVQSNTIQP